MDINQLNQHLTTVGARWEARANEVALLPKDQQLRRLGVAINGLALAALRQQHLNIGIAANYPASWDWRDRPGVVSAPKNQGNCGSCVSFGTIGALEAQLAIEQHLLIDFSEADLHFCSDHGATCDGWWPDDALNSLQTRGVTDSNSFPYSLPEHCTIAPNREKRLAKIGRSVVVNLVEERKAYLSSIGPLISVMGVYDDFFSYHRGIYHPISTNLAGYHCILCIGYDDAQKSWICKNSWGPNWGDGGFFQIGYGECGIDSQFPGWGLQQTSLTPALQQQKESTLQWLSLGGICTSAPALAIGPNRSDVFVRGNDNALWWRWQVSPGGGWQGWASLGGNLAGSPSAAWMQDKLVVAAPWRDGIYTIQFSGGKWGEWQKLDPDVSSTGGATLAADGGNLHIAKIGSDLALYCSVLPK